MGEKWRQHKRINKEWRKNVKNWTKQWRESKKNGRAKILKVK
jgi:hypothetical protein